MVHLDREENHLEPKPRPNTLVLEEKAMCAFSGCGQELQEGLVWRQGRSENLFCSNPCTSLHTAERKRITNYHTVNLQYGS